MPFSSHFATFSLRVFDQTKRLIPKEEEKDPVLLSGSYGGKGKVKRSTGGFGHLTKLVKHIRELKGQDSGRKRETDRPEPQTE